MELQPVTEDCFLAQPVLTAHMHVSLTKKVKQVPPPPGVFSNFRSRKALFIPTTFFFFSFKFPLSKSLAEIISLYYAFPFQLAQC